MGGGLVCSPTLPLFSPFAGIPVFPPVPRQPLPTPTYSPSRHPVPRGHWGRGLTRRSRRDIREGLSRDQRAGRGHIRDEEQ